MRRRSTDEFSLNLLWLVGEPGDSGITWSCAKHEPSERHRIADIAVRMSGVEMLEVMEEFRLHCMEFHGGA